MTTKTMMTVEEYLRTSFDGADCDYVDGEVLERNMGELPHARVQIELASRLRERGAVLSIEVLTEIRTQVSNTRFRVADIAVWRRGNIGKRIPTVPPFLAVEILSAEDRLVRLQPKIQDYLRYGVEWVWVIDPDERRALSFTAATPGGTEVTVLRTDGPAIAIDLVDLLSILDQD